MSEKRVERRLAAILAADVAGYSRLMGQDEEGTLAALKALRRELADPKIKEHRGRIVKTTGDGLLVEFASVVDRVRCAVEVQREMAERNNGVPAERRIEFRVGINLGDIIIDDRDIFGDGVNVAARLEGLAEPGGICVSRVVRDQVRDKSPLPLTIWASSRSRISLGRSASTRCASPVTPMPPWPAQPRWRRLCRFPTSLRSPSCPSPI
jgi:adenylate cyclase